MAIPKRKCEEIWETRSKHRKIIQPLTLLDLPAEVILIIISHLDCESTDALLASCKQLHKTFVENSEMFNLVLRLKHPYEYFNYQLLQYYCTSIKKPLRQDFEQLLSMFKRYSKSWHYIVPICHKGNQRVKLKLEPITSVRTRVFLQSCVNFLFDLQANSYENIFYCLKKCKVVGSVSSCSPSIKDTVRSEMLCKLRKFPEGYATLHIMQIIVILLDLINKT